ncbi:MAG: hypothetical protein OQL21_06505 [Gammaproteobacteria bacterium]|nr:hypothetical protein [Gammaproteobacteria bacterium]
MLFALVILALAAFAGAMLTYTAGFATAVPVHLALASGAMPLIAGAMLHFVPVLTRTMGTDKRLNRLPWLMLLAGLLAVSSFLFPSSAVAMRTVAALIGILGTVIISGWIVRLSRKSLGSPHPGTYWYLAAMGCLLLGLLAVVLMQLWSSQYLPLRRFHLHLNTLGFIGITAVGTLQVLLPTAAGQPDPGVAQRLRRDLRWVLSGTLLIAGGAAWQGLLVWPGVVVWLLPSLRLATAWHTLYRKAPEKWNGSATAIAGGLAGFIAILLFGAGHAAGFLSTSQASIAYLFAFLLPLITGAAGYLLPLWLRPGMQTPWHSQAREGLARFGLLRVVLFIGAGALSAWDWSDWGWLPAAAALLLFVIQLRHLVRQ